jgi:hypothetical protein
MHDIHLQQRKAGAVCGLFPHWGKPDGGYPIVIFLPFIERSYTKPELI